MNLYSLRSIKKRYNNEVILDLCHLDILAGRCYRLTGQNGAGKSTLLNILAFLSPPTSGQIYFEDAEVNWKRSTLLALRKKVTLLHQSSYLFSGTVFDNIAYGLNARKVPSDQQRQLISEALVSVGLDGFLMRNITNLSGGESQRVAIARALVLKPLVLLLDEPFSNVDRETAEAMEKIILSLPEKGTTVIMAIHDLLQQSLSSSCNINLVHGRLCTEIAKEVLKK